jgi:hypothetical protein
LVIRPEAIFFHADFKESRSGILKLGSEISTEDGMLLGRLEFYNMDGEGSDVPFSALVHDLLKFS